MANTTVTFNISEEQTTEANNIAAELGVAVEDLAKTAFETYLEVARADRLSDWDEQTEIDA